MSTARYDEWPIKLVELIGKIDPWSRYLCTDMQTTPIGDGGGLRVVLRLTSDYPGGPVSEALGEKQED